MDLLLANLARLIEGAVRAPSGDNTQPWRFEADTNELRLTVRVDETRDPSPMNAGQRMARIAVGAALENIFRMAGNSGMVPSLAVSPEGVVVQFDERLRSIPIEPDRTIMERVTNRWRYQRQDVSQQDRRRMEEAMGAPGGVAVEWVTEPAEIDRWARLVALADAELFSLQETRAAFLENIRFDLGYDDVAGEGLGLSTLGATRLEVRGLRMMRSIPSWLFSFLRMGKQFGRNAERLARSASGICVGTADSNAPQTDFLVGRAMQRAWLAISEFGHAAQPMMSIAVLENLALHGSPESSARATEAIRRIAAGAPESYPRRDQRRAAFLLRFGRPAREAAKSGRLQPNVLGSLSNATIDR